MFSFIHSLIHLFINPFLMILSNVLSKSCKESLIYHLPVYDFILTMHVNLVYNQRNTYNTIFNSKTNK